MKECWLMGAWLSLLLLASCDASGFDAEHDCREAMACWNSAQCIVSDDDIPRPCDALPSSYTVDSCTENTEKFYEEASGDKQAAMDEMFDKCGEQTGCCYVDCVCEWQARGQREFCARLNGPAALWYRRCEDRGYENMDLSDCP